MNDSVKSILEGKEPRLVLSEKPRSPFAKRSSVRGHIIDLNDVIMSEAERNTMMLRRPLKRKELKKMVLDLIASDIDDKVLDAAIMDSVQTQLD